MQRRIMQISLADINWERVQAYFYGYTHVDIDHIEDQYEDYVLPMKELLEQEGILKIICQGEKIIEKKEDKIILRDGQVFEGKMIAKAYEDADEIILYVISILNMDKLLQAHPDMMETFFLEYWAVSILNACREQFCDLWTREIHHKKKKLTSVWSPGQARFELHNQKTLFRLLKPEEMGVILDQYMRMIPLKTVSGTVGIIPEDVEIKLISCDYCQHALTCPGYAGEKYKDSGLERRIF